MNNIILWPISDIKREIEEIKNMRGSKWNHDEHYLRRVKAILHELHFNASMHGMLCLARPNIYYDRDCGIVIEWYYKTRVLSFWHNEKDQKTMMRYQIRYDDITEVHRGDYTEVGPASERIKELLFWVCGIFKLLEKK